MKTIKNVDDYIACMPDWAIEHLVVLRTILAGTQLHESIKWGAPTYSGKGNVVSLASFKEYVSVWFFQGALLTDIAGVLSHDESTAKAMRHWRFKPFEEIDTKLFKQYLYEAIDNDLHERKVAFVKKTRLEIPELLQNAMNANSKIYVAFHKLSPSQQREYCEHIESAKKAETQETRLNNSIDLIKENKGLNDKYKK